MKQILIVLLIILTSCRGGQKDYKETLVEGSNIKALDYDGLEYYIENHPSETLVINFWATWCAPCIKELPAFEKLEEEYKSKDVTVLLVSLDFPDQLEALKTFVDKKKLQSEVLYLDDGDANNWIPKVSDSWSGAIPATLITGSKRKKFYERSFTYEELEQELNTLIN
ncbi:TlpA disulfide reductase family protein [Dokdonia sp. PRO95]|uniref:TlpA family protein disulfide reductase n=1 Tax=Dokdonia sp. PRO95 TaxID=1239415 RepID=UPI000552A8D2|nr:TlpA disulfide reductase family protein [Dokdonia sp. PRO95]